MHVSSLYEIPYATICQGTMWFNELGYEPVVAFSNLLNWTAMALGNQTALLWLSVPLTE